MLEEAQQGRTKYRANLACAAGFFAVYVDYTECSITRRPELSID